MQTNYERINKYLDGIGLNTNREKKCMILQFQLMNDFDLLVICALNEGMFTQLRNGLMKN